MNLFQETLLGHHSQAFTVDTVLHRGRSGLQDVLVFENRVFGRVLVLDGLVQLTERDNHIYHEMIAHVPLMAHGSARRVLIIGGGDGGTLKEVLKHPLEQAVLVEIDEEVIHLSKQFFPQVAGGAFEDARSTIIIGDGVRYLAETGSRFDVIIVDSTDPVGPGEQLFTAEFYRRCRQVLLPGGMIAVQSGAAFYQPHQLGGVCDRIASSFDAVRPFLAPVPTYAAGMLALVVAGDDRQALCPSVKVLQERLSRLRAEVSFYTPAVHRAAFMMTPRFTSEMGSGAEADGKSRSAAAAASLTAA